MWWGFNLEEERKGRELEYIHSDLVSTAVCFEYDIPIFKLILLLQLILTYCRVYISINVEEMSVSS